MKGPTRRRLLDAARLYVVLDREVGDYPALFKVLKKTVQAGAGIVQLRDKNSLSLDVMNACTRSIKIIRNRVPFIVNDRIDIAQAVRADGVHLGQDDMPLKYARELLGQEMLIGVSCQTVSQALKAQADGADYIGFGSVFRTKTKPDRRPMDLEVWRTLYKKIEIPVFAIGGISLSNLMRLLPLGINRVAVTRAVCQADNVAQVTRGLIDFLDMAQMVE